MNRTKPSGEPIDSYLSLSGTLGVLRASGEDPLLGGERMKSVEQISAEVDSWIIDAPTSTLKAVRTSARYFDPCEGEDDDEREAYHEYRWWFLTKDHQAIMDIPVQDDNVWLPYEPDQAISFPFTSVNFEKQPKIKPGKYKMKMLTNEIKDIAQTHSCVTNEESRQHLKRRFDEIVKIEFTDKIAVITDNLAKHPMFVDKIESAKRISELRTHAFILNKVWMQYAYEP